MMPLIVLLIVFILSVLLIKRTSTKNHYALAGRIAMSVMLLFTAVGHFAFTDGMAMMLPPFIPFKTELVYLTIGGGYFFVIKYRRVMRPDAAEGCSDPPQLGNDRQG